MAAQLVAVEPRWPQSTIIDQPDDTTTIALVLCDKPVLMNEVRNMHFRVERQHIKFWREAFSEMAENCPRMEWATLVVHHEVGRRILPDYGACMPSVKWALDGCRDHEVDGVMLRRILADDSWPHLRGLMFAQPSYTGRYALTLELTGPTAR